MYKSTHSSLPSVFSPLKLGTVTVHNRVLLSGLHLGVNHSEDPFQRLIDFFEPRASTGVGLIIVGGCSPNKVGRIFYDNDLCISNDSLISEHSKVVSTIKKNGSAAVLQLCHFGSESFHPHLIAPTPIRIESNFFTPKVISDDDIEKTIDDFAQAALRARKAGYDMIEIVGSQGFLIHEFFSKRTNQREDKWGGSIENRARFAIEVLRRSKQLAGADFPIIFRMPSLDLIKGGIEFEEFRQILKSIVAEKPVLINVSIGWHHSPTPTLAMNVPPASFAPVAKYVKSISQGIPVAVSNRINDLRIGEQLLQDGVADVIAMGRPFLADPFLLEKSKNEQWDSINTCIACNQACLDNALRGKAVGCIVNPQCGLPEESLQLKTSNKRSFSIIGGGVAGMSAALWLKRFGHDVELFEKRTFLGGQLRLAVHIPSKEIFNETLRYFEHALYTERVDVKKGRAWHLNDHKKGTHVILATGALPRKVSFPVAEDANLIYYDDLLLHRLPVIHPIVIIGSGAITVDLLSYLSNDKKWEKDAFAYLEQSVDPDQINVYKSLSSEAPEISVLCRSVKAPGHTIGATTRWINLKKVEKSVRFIKQAEVLSVEKSKVTYKDKAANDIVDIQANTVIVAIGQTPNTHYLKSVLDSQNIEYTSIGPEEAKSRYSAGEAIRQGYLCAKQFL